MKIIKNKNYKKMIVVIIAAVMVLAAGLVGYNYIRASHSTPPSSSNDNSSSDKKINDINLAPPTTGETTAGEVIKKNSIDSQSTATGDNSAVSVTVQGLKKDTQVVFDTLIQAVSNDGQCSLSITSGGQTVVKTTGIFANPSSSSCKGFSVSTSELPKGTWTATLTVTIGSRTGTSKVDISVES